MRQRRSEVLIREARVDVLERDGEKEEKRRKRGKESGQENEFK